MKKFFFITSILFLLVSGVNFAFAQDVKIEINFFYSPTCSVCANEKGFLDDLEQQYAEIKVNRFNIFKKESIELLKKLYQEYNVPRTKWGLVPLTFSQERYFVGFNQTIAQEIESCIERCISGAGTEKEQETKGIISLPLLAEISAAEYSLPVLSVILGFFDGFNICSLGALVLILGLVLVLRSRKKILIFGGIFIATTAVMYGFLIMLWYKVFSFLGSYLGVMEILVGFFGIGGGIYFLREFFRFKKYGPTCRADTGKGMISRFSSKMQETLKGKGSIFVVMLSILFFAVVITVVEFPCSAVVPLFFASALSQAQLSLFHYLLYIAIFVLFYMLDEIIVFLLAFFTMTIKLTSTKFITWITLLESIVLFFLGFYYLLGFFV